MTQELTTPQPVQIRVLEELKKDNRLPALVAAVESVKAPESVKEEVVTNFADFFERIERYVTPAFALIVADETEKEKMFDAAQAVTALKGLEKSLTAKHGELKEDALRYGQTLDAAKRAALALIQPAIEHLKAQAEYIERKEAVRVEALRVERYALILPYIETVPMPWPNWGAMTKTEFQDNLAYFQEKSRQIEAERLARIEREKAEREELGRLRKEQAEKDALIAKAQAAQREAEREMAIAKQAAERAEQDAKQAIANHFKDYGKPVDQIIAETKESRQTDREKLRAYGDAILQVQCAPIQDPAMRKVLQDVKILLGKIDKFIEDKTKP